VTALKRAPSFLGKISLRDLADLFQIDIEEEKIEILETIANTENGTLYFEGKQGKVTRIVVFLTQVQMKLDRQICLLLVTSSYRRIVDFYVGQVCHGELVVRLNNMETEMVVIMNGDPTMQIEESLSPDGITTTSKSFLTPEDFKFELGVAETVFKMAGLLPKTLLEMEILDPIAHRHRKFIEIVRKLQNDRTREERSSLWEPCQPAIKEILNNARVITDVKWPRYYSRNVKS
jgi:hypothetical protein